MEKRILLASPRGFCAGVRNAVAMLEEAVKSGKVYVRGEIVHNKALAEQFATAGAVQVGEVGEVPEGGTVVFSAHGVAPSVREQAKARNLKIIDATCPFVTKVHEEAKRLSEAGCTIILIGDSAHDEVIGIVGEAPDNITVIQSEEDVDGLAANGKIAWLSQTTLNADTVSAIAGRLRAKFPQIAEPPLESRVCGASRNRQEAVKRIAGECDLFAAVGSANSSNTLRLVEAAYSAGAAKAVRVDNPADLDGIDLASVYTVGITSGVSVADEQFESVVAYFEEKGYTRDYEGEGL